MNARPKAAVCGALLFAIATVVWTPSSQASEVDLLITKLVAKGVLTETEALDLRADIAREASPAVPVQDLGRPAAAAQGARSSLLDRIALKGDFRLRYQTEDLSGPVAAGLDIDEQDRWRIRWRAGVVVDVTDKWETGFGFASGGSSARSSNQTLRRAFARGDARLDYAYAKYTASENVTLLGGKFKNPIWTPKDLLWDSDIRPDGVAAPMSFELSDRTELFVTPAYLVLNEDLGPSQSDASVAVLQVGATMELSESISLKLAPAYYAFANLAGTPGPISLDARTNSRDLDGNLVNDYDALAVGGQLTFSDLDWVPKVSVFGEWVTAFDPATDETGWLLGISFGDAKIAQLGDWQFKYNYRKLQSDAWPEFLADSDAFFGGTNVKGSELELVWGLASGVSVSVDYYGGFKFLGSDLEQDLLQLDLNIKW